MLTMKTVKHGGFKELKEAPTTRTFAKAQVTLDTLFIYQYDSEGIPTGCVKLTKEQVKQLAKMFKEGK